jgi:6-pyruvoyltetrahydropterin/6-carboxytetrahydropterin synthase
MYLIAVEESFDAAHFLREYGGKCETLHGHSFRAVARLRCPRLNEIGLAYDFTLLKKQFHDVLATYDHHCFNEVPPFDKMNPSSENIAREVFDQLRKMISGEAVLESVEIWESPQSCAIYKPD